MTWFLDSMARESRDITPRDQPVRRGPDIQRAARDARAIEVDYWSQTRRRREGLIGEMVEAMGGIDAIAPTSAEDIERTSTWSVPWGTAEMPARPDDWSTLFEGQPVDQQIDWIMERAGPLAASDPARWGDRPLDRDQFEAEIKRRQLEDLREAQKILAGHDGWLNPLIGALTIDATDEVTLPFWLVGGNPMRAGVFIARETLIGAAAEIAALPKEQRQAARLELQEPNALERIAMGALAGGVLGGTIAAGARGVEYLRLRNRTEAEAAPGPEAAAAANAAERALREGREPEVPQAGAGDMGDSDIVARIIGIESGGNPRAQNPLSSARGLGQFIESTWMDMITRHRPDLLAGRSRAQVLALRDDPDLNRAMTTAFMQENRARLQAAGVPDDPGALYLAHFMGAGGAIRALRAAPDTPISALMTAAEIRANAGVRWNGRSFAQFTAADLRAWSSGRMGAAPSGRATAAAAGAGEAGGPITPPGQRFDFGAPTSRPMTRFDEVVTPAGTRVPVEYRVVDLDSLTPARGEFQPRDRTRAGSDEQVAEIAARLDAMRLMPGPEADRGAPIVGPDMMVESGNGRVMALRRAADQHPDRFDAYREAIRAAGFEVPEDIARPALVAVRQGDMTPAQRRAFVAEANDSGTMRMAATEQAGRDADFLSGPVMDAYVPGQPVAQQGEFLRRLLGGMSQSERAAMIGADGRLNADGLRRVRQALFARAYGAPDLLRVLAESPDPRLRAMLDMLDELAPDWAAFRAQVAAGAIRPEFDITDAMVDMVRTIARARTEGRDGQSVIAAIRDRMAQGDMFAQADTGLSEALLAAFYRGQRARRPADTGDILRRYIAEADQLGRPGDLLGAVPPVEVLQAAVRNHEGRTDYAMPGPRTDADVSVPRLEDADPAPMLDGAASPVLVRADDATEDAMRAAVAPRTDDATPAPRATEATPPARPPDVDVEPDLSWLATAPKTMETVRRLVDMANVAAPRGYRFRIKDNDIWLYAPDGELRATRFLDLNISPRGIHRDLQNAIDLATDNAAGADSALRFVTLPDDVDPAAVRAAREALWDDPAAANMTPQEEIVEAVIRARAGGATEATPAGEQVLIPGVAPVSQRARLEAQMARPATGRDTGPGSGREDLFGNPEDRRDLFDGAATAPPAGGEAAAVAAAAREYAALRDLSVRMSPEPDAPEVRVADLLDDLRENATLSDAVASCVTRRGG